MIRKINVENYKSLPKLCLELGRVTILIRANGSGSNILERSHLLRQQPRTSCKSLANPVRMAIDVLAFKLKYCQPRLIWATFRDAPTGDQ